MAHTDSSRENEPYSLIPENGNESHQLLHEGTDEEVICYGSKIDYKKTFLYYLCCLLSCGFFVLVGYWRPDWRHKWTHSMCPFQEADSVFIKDQYNRWYPAKILQLVDNTRRENSNGKQMIHETNDDPTDALGNGTNPLDVKYFKFHCLRYFWNPQIQHFTVLRGLDRNFTCREIYDRFSRGLDNHQAGRRAIIYEQNLIDVKVKSYIRLLFEVALNPFYVFQVFSVTLWFFDDYYYYAGCIVFVSVVSIAITLVQTRRNRVRLRNMVATSSNIQVIRNHSGDPENVSSTEIVPGDVIVIPPDGIRMECDAVLISGSCVVNESSLTGESNPVLKTQLISDGADADNVYYPNLHKQHSLFAGTQVLQARSYSSSLVTALVTRTGFYSMKGNLVRSILYPKPMNLKLYRDAIGFVGCLAFLALIGLIYSIVTLIIDGVTPGEVIKRALDMITIAVPPALPAAVSIGTVYATNRLRVRGIFCINPSRINLSGKLNLVCFDKTGTLTEDFLEFWGVSSVKQGRFREILTDIKSNPADKLAVTMATCHSLTVLKGDVCGDPLDMQMFQATQWTLDESADDHQKYDTVIQASVKPPSSTPTTSQNQFEYGILKRYAFTSDLKRMSVLIRKLGAGNLELVMKGAPETVIQYCNSSSVPDDFSQTLESLTEQGYRVLGLAHRSLDSKLSWRSAQKLSRQDLEENMTFLGLLIMQNKLKPETSGIIEELAEANIRTVMITGDNLKTAVNIARECEMIQPNENVVHLIAKEPTTSQTEPTVTWNLIKKSGNAPVLSSAQYYRPTSDRIACTGDTVSVIQKYLPNMLEKVLIQGTIFARTSPKQKAELVEGFQNLGYYVGMCGDGANDCGALNTAHAGISLSEAEASVASPFTSKVPNISCVSTLIREGRAALITAFGVFKYMALYSIIQFTTVMILYWYVANLGDFQFLFIDLFIILSIALVMSRTEAFPLISKQRPNSSLTSFETLSSLFAHVIVTVASQTLVYFYLASQPWYVENVDTVNGSTYVQCYETTTLFYFTNYQYIWIAVVFSKGPPFRKRIYTNWAYLFVLISLLAIATVFILHPGSASVTFELKAITDITFKVCLILLGIAYFCVCFLLEEFLITAPYWRPFWSCIKCTRRRPKKFEQLESSLIEEAWPPASNFNNPTVTSNPQKKIIRYHYESQI